jgi:hypothetical protein
VLCSVALGTPMWSLLNLLMASLPGKTFSKPTFTSKKMKNFCLLLQKAVYLRTEQ